MQQITQLIIICSFIVPQVTHADSRVFSIKDAIEVAIEQQNLSQKISKIYLNLCYNTRNTELYKERTTSVKQFEEQLYQLGLFVPNDRVKKHIQIVREVWKTYKGIADWSIKKESIHTLLNSGEELLKASQMLYAAYQEYENTLNNSNDWITMNQYISQLQHQKTSMQRILIYHMANEQASDILDYSLKLEASKKIFMRRLTVLEEAATTSIIVQEHLQLIRREWTSILEQLETKNTSVEKLDKILYKGITIEENIDKILSEYKQLKGRMLDSKNQ